MHETVRSVIKPKWSLEILAALSAESPQNFSQIETQLETSSDIITKRLRLLEKYGLIDRTEHTTKNVQYEITERGEEVLKRLETIDTLLENGR
ncbi:winged helix-turn-helix transcriptional regulator [Halobellus ruber]|uniref:Helix-turn-helix transcriptional regulator n=1 Tax=Halobellus ruber TaxID=2761102 RepID=A0A7J9SNR7_9EURY|nr:winged helix-turn-helix transcriptional regulator [Halobellus ruber]MBB6647866.1 helix-turn-helix transcriptional regulator [Halobellus ruber]